MLYSNCDQIIMDNQQLKILLLKLYLEQFINVIYLNIGYQKC